jgi:predicted alpha/beta-hydrolase family hydrolase
MSPPVELSFQVSESAGCVSGLLLRPAAATGLYVLAHGAGAGMRHAFMEAIAGDLAQQGVATLRYQFPYMEQGSRRPSPRPLLLRTIRAAIEQARELAPELPLIAGGKSMGGRMTSLAAAQEPLQGVRGIAFLGFPLHPAGKPGTERGEHLFDVQVPMLFLQGDRDKLAELPLLQPICERLGARATLHLVAGGDHSFHVLKRSGRTDSEVRNELATALPEWARKLA